MDTHLCTEPDDDDNFAIEESYFACKELKCEMRRPFDTSDIYDLDFDSTGATENMLIAATKASIQINQDPPLTNFVLTVNNSAATIKVVKGALSDLVISAFAVSSLLAAFSF